MRINSDAGTLTLTGNIDGAGLKLKLGGAGGIAISGNIGNLSGPLTKDGSGTVILSGGNSYTGGTRVESGVLRFKTDAALGAPSTPIVLTGGGAIGSIAEPDSDHSSSRTIELVGSGGIDVPSRVIPTDPPIFFTWTGNIVGNGQLIKQGFSKLELTGANSYSGGTLVKEGTLQVASDDKLGAPNTKVELSNNATLWASDSFTTTRAMALTGVGGIFQAENGTSFTLNGIVSGKDLTKVGLGTLVLANNNNSYGNTIVLTGTVRGSARSIRGNISFNSNAANTALQNVTFDQPTDDTFAGNIINYGSITKIGDGTLTLTGANTYSRGTTVTAGTLRGNSNSLQGDIVNNAKVIFNQDIDTGTYAGAMTGSGSLVKKGNGKLFLTGTSTVGGGTTLNAGGLSINGRLTTNFTLNDGILYGARQHRRRFRPERRRGRAGQFDRHADDRRQLHDPSGRRARSRSTPRATATASSSSARATRRTLRRALSMSSRRPAAIRPIPATRSSLRRPAASPTSER